MTSIECQINFLSEKLNCTVEEITRIEAGIFEKIEIVDKIVDFLDIKGDFFL
ncbi:helix-turn-helix domain-containing protein [Lysinibacillus composti]|uniref:helix-turn-helix domain-containing protein n=1 Tax=Lysinibacillus composti TaxID=720633 RepID=UPI0019614603|nr:helix-turn-helix transcriptional regulator [Lysinibacillus composti]